MSSAGRPAALLKKSAVPLLLVFVLLLVLLQARQALESAGVAVEHLQLADDYRTPALHFIPAAGQRSGVVAVLVHGHQCNKAMLAQLARYLAGRGVEAYAIDLPGHGESPSTFAPDRAASAAASAVAAILGRSGIHPARLALIGHSFGAVVLGPVALQLEPVATVLLGPGKADGLSWRSPGNVLIVTAEHDYDFIKRDAQAMYEELTAGASQARGNRVGNFEQRDARLWEEIPNASHMSLLRDPRVYQSVAEWIERAAGSTIPLQSPDTSGATRRAALTALALSLLLALLIARQLGHSASIGVVAQDRNWVRPAIATVAGLYFAAIVTQEWVPLRFLHLEEGAVLASLMAIAGILGLAFFAPLGASIICRFRAADALAAVALLLALYGLTLVTVDREFYTLRIAVGDWRRLLTLAVIAAAAAPFFLLQEELLRRLQGCGRGRVRELAMLAGGALALVVAFAVALHFTGGRLYRFEVALAGLLVYCAAVSAILRAAAGNTSAGVLFSSLVTGWIVAVGFFHY